VHLHFTPTYSSWLNQVELWFSKIERDVIYRGVFTSVKELAHRIMTYVHKHNEQAKPFSGATMIRRDESPLLNIQVYSPLVARISVNATSRRSCG
jgi:transposase